MISRIGHLDRLQVVGVVLIFLVVAATATWRASGSPTPELLGPVHSKIEIGTTPAQVDSRPEAVKVAEEVLAARLRVTQADLPKGVRMTSPSADVRVICSEGTCAALRGSTHTYTVTSGKGAASKALTLLLDPRRARAESRGGRR